jgi:hypothetical protein
MTNSFHQFRAIGGRCATFPVSMLRFGECWPATDEDAIKIEHSIRGDWGQTPESQIITLRTSQSEVGRIMSERRWSSFGWRADYNID